MISHRVLRTKIIPPTPGMRILPRERVNRTLTEALQYRLTLLQASAGYGKSTALSLLAHTVRPVIWYQVMEEDTEPLVLLLHLCHAVQQALPGIKGLPTSYLEDWDGLDGPLPAQRFLDEIINALSEYLSGPALMIIDDVHLALSTPEIPLLLDRLAGLAPAHLHLLLSGRPPLQLPNLGRWRARGEALTLDQTILAFTVEEIDALFSQHYGWELAGEEVEELREKTEGWAIALQLVWQGLRSGASASVEDSFDRETSSPQGLFDLLAQEIFDVQPADVQEFLLVSATLREMTPESCDALRKVPSGSTDDSARLMTYLVRQELFVVDLGGQPGSMRLRYHHIFRSFLRRRAAPERQRAWHHQAAVFFQEHQDFDGAIYHLLRAEDQDGAAALISEHGAGLVATGRLDGLAGYLDSLQPETLRRHPALLFYLGDLARLHSRFDEALGWYQQAEALWREHGNREGIGRALRGQARIYLDTVNPSQAEALLQQAIRISDGIEDRESQARLYDLLAENKLNAGRVEEAEHLSRQAQALRSEGPSNTQLLYRVLLRTGRLDEARLGLESRAVAERQSPVQTPRAHRETQLLLSLIYSLQGRGEQALQAAQEGTRRGEELQSPFVAAVGHMRQGHALMLLPYQDRYARSLQQFKRTFEISNSLSVSRLRVEAGWGLCRAYGYQGELAQAQAAAQEAIEIAAQAGDEWIASLVRLSMGASLVLAVRSAALHSTGPAEGWLSQAARGFRECSDNFGRTAARLWLCLGWMQESDRSWKERLTRLQGTLPEVLAASREGGYDFLFTRSSLLGPPDARLLVPLLILARDHGWEASYALRLLDEIGLPDISLHPGYQLRVQTLGGFQVWRGEQPVSSKNWRREKARQLFQLLLSDRGALLDRDQITEALWPAVDADTAGRNFKVTLNSLYHTLETEREPGQESAYILREGSAYGLRPGADLWLDAEVFTRSTVLAMQEPRPEAAIKLLETAIELYRGEYLPDARYESWAVPERERMAVLFLRAADRLANLLIDQGCWERAIQVCSRILEFDSCWERAYRQLMVAYDRLGDHGQVARTFQRCVHHLGTELDVTPSQETKTLYRELAIRDQ